MGLLGTTVELLLSVGRKKAENTALFVSLESDPQLKIPMVGNGGVEKCFRTTLPNLKGKYEKENEKTKL